MKQRPSSPPNGARGCVRALEGGTHTLLDVRAQPGAKRNGFAGWWNGVPKIAVSAAPENGRANAAIAEEIAALFGLRASAVSLESGATARMKTFRLACAPSIVEARLKELES